MRIFCLILMLLGGMVLTPAEAQNRAKVERQFQTWLQQDIWPEAKRKGVRRGTFEQAFAGVTLNWDLPDLVPPGSAPPKKRRQRQAEFGAPSRYFAPANLRSGTAIGRDMAGNLRGTLQRVSRQTGVPGHILLAIWGRESAYGRAKINNDAFAVLGTKGFMSTRAPYFRDELIAALQIAQAGHVAPRAMKSSWAGALGQPQFMPSNFLTYAADGNGDGRADIWGSQADTLASIGNYLTRHGWQSGRDWGFEVSIPASLSCALEGPDQRRSIAEWEKLGITRVSGRPFPAHERRGQASLMLPAGRLGPAFLVTPNFYVLKDYNFSDLYALYVGHMGDRIAYGSKGFRAPWQKVDAMLRSDVAQMQRGLERLGHDVGGADGLVGFKTRRAIGRWQEAKGRTATCFPDKALLRAFK